MDSVWLGLLWFVAFLFSMVLHEAAHAWAAARLGDPTALLAGQVSLNPLPHMQREPIGTLVAPLLSFALAGWMVGWASAPFDPRWAQRYPKRLGLVSLAGPMANLLLVLGAGIILKAGLAFGWFIPPDGFSLTQVVAAGPPSWAHGPAVFLSILFTLNLILMAFNLLPAPPLDGASILLIGMPDRWADTWLRWIHQPHFALLGLLLAWNLFGSLVRPLYKLGLILIYA